MAFTVKGSNGAVELELSSDGCGGVDLVAGDFVLLSINEDGALVVHDGIAGGDVGNLQLAELCDNGWGDGEMGRPAVFFKCEELVRPSTIKAAAPKKTKRSKKAEF